MKTWILMIVAFVLDALFNAIIAIDFAWNGLNFTPAFALLALIIIARDYDLIESGLIGWLTGFAYGVMNYEAVLIFSFVFMIIALIANIWSKFISFSMIEYVTLSFTMVAIKEFITFLFFQTLARTNIPFSLWLEKQLFLTVLLNVFSSVIIFLFSNYLLKHYQTKSFKTNI